MNWTAPHTSVISALCLALAQLPDGVTQRPTAITDPDAYTIYSLVLPRAWATVSKEPLLLQEETEVPPDAACLVVPSRDPGNVSAPAGVDGVCRCVGRWLQSSEDQGDGVPAASHEWRDAVPGASERQLGQRAWRLWMDRVSSG
jgi:hypothetical protein